MRLIFGSRPTPSSTGIPVISIDADLKTLKWPIGLLCSTVLLTYRFWSNFTEIKSVSKL